MVVFFPFFTKISSLIKSLSNLYRMRKIPAAGDTPRGIPQSTTSTSSPPPSSAWSGPPKQWSTIQNNSNPPTADNGVITKNDISDNTFGSIVSNSLNKPSNGYAASVNPAKHASKEGQQNSLSIVSCLFIFFYFYFLLTILFL